MLPFLAALGGRGGASAPVMREETAARSLGPGRRV